MAILVTGAAGFVGRYLCAGLEAARRDYVPLDLPGCDITDPAAVGRCFAGRPIEAVIHLASVLPTASRRDPALATRVNVLGSMNVLEAAVAFGVPRFVFASSISVYGSAPRPRPVSEDDAAAPDDPYGAAKRYVEILGGSLGLSFVALRLCTLVGPGARQTASPWRSEIFEGAHTVRLPFGPSDRLAILHAADAAAMLLLLADAARPVHSLYNSPAETWSGRDLKAVAESRARQLTVELTGGQAPPPLADGSRFILEFGYQPRHLFSDPGQEPGSSATLVEPSSYQT